MVRIWWLMYLGRWKIRYMWRRGVCMHSGTIPRGRVYFEWLNSKRRHFEIQYNTVGDLAQAWDVMLG